MSYGHVLNLKETLEYDFSQERNFRYNGLSMPEVIHHLSVFISRLWQIHVFGEGNTRTTAVFFIKYLRQLGFEADNDMFAEHSWYFRNALVRANYSNIKQDIDPINDPINTAGLSEREKKVLELLRQDPTLTRAKMAGILGCSDATVKRALGSMVQKNVIRRIGSNKKGEWVINS